MKALIIIDMQKVSFTDKTPRWDSSDVIDRINQLADNFRLNGDMVIFIQHDGTLEGQCIPGSAEWEILDELVVNEGDIVIPKIANDAFYRSSLLSLLRNENIDEVVITGCATDFCVDSTVKAGLTHDLDITIIADGHTTADRDDIPSEKLIKHYNWIWGNLTPTKGRIKVIPFREYSK